MVSKERLSHGERIHRRREKAKERASVEYLNQYIIEKEDAEERVKELKDLLQNNNLDPNRRALFSIEKEWAQFLAGHTKGGKRMSAIVRKLNKLKKETPEVYEWLTKPDENGSSILVKVRDRYCRPPMKRRF